MRAPPLRLSACLVLAFAGLLPVRAQDGSATSDGSPPPASGLPSVGGPDTQAAPPDAPGAPSNSAAPPPDARSAGSAPLPKPAKSKVEELDYLFGELKREASADEAAKIAARIQAKWQDSGSATVDLLMLRAAQAVARENAAAAFDLLDQAIELDPSYSEAWNRRATLNFTQSEFGRSIADVEQTLAREPRHFGALMGLGAMLEELDRKQQALEAYSRVLTLYPALKNAQDAVVRLSDELTGQAI